MSTNPRHIATSAVGARRPLSFCKNSLDFRAAGRHAPAVELPAMGHPLTGIHRKLLPTAPMGTLGPRRTGCIAGVSGSFHRSRLINHGVETDFPRAVSEYWGGIASGHNWVNS